MGRSLKGTVCGPATLRKGRAGDSRRQSRCDQDVGAAVYDPPEFIGRSFDVHNGKIFKRVFVTEDMVGHKLGEFSLTRIWKGHGSGRRPKRPRRVQRRRDRRRQGPRGKVSRHGGMDIHSSIRAESARESAAGDAAYCRAACG